MRSQGFVFFTSYSNRAFSYVTFFNLFSFTACVQVKSKLHAEGMPATGADIQGEKKNL